MINKFRGLVLNFLLAGISVLFALIILEIGYRYLCEKPKHQPPKTNWAIVPEKIWTEYHPALGWFHQKNKTAIVRLKGMQVELHTNSVGFRGRREHSIEKPPQTIRILALGDS